MLSRPFPCARDVAGHLKVRQTRARRWRHAGDPRAIDAGRERRIAPKDPQAVPETRRSTRPGGAESGIDRAGSDDQSKQHDHG